MPMPDEQRRLQKENAEADERPWSNLHNIHASTAADHKELVTTAQRTFAAGEAAAADAAPNAERARERLAKIERGEDVAGGLSKPMARQSFEHILLDAGWTNGDIRNAEHLANLLDELERHGVAKDFWNTLNKRKHNETADLRLRRQAERDVVASTGSCGGIDP
jgi:hypothetical protein